jgi:hypothetical protein
MPSFYLKSAHILSELAQNDDFHYRRFIDRYSRPQARNATGGAFLRQGGAWRLASALHGGSIWRPTKNRGFLRFSRAEIKMDQSTLS